jgi:hypothetical protein
MAASKSSRSSIDVTPHRPGGQEVHLGDASLSTSFDLYGHLDTRDLAADLALITAEENPPE